MKFNKIFLIFTLLFITFLGVIYFTSCEQDPCTSQNCLNGGSCGGGVCNCPVGYDGTFCQTKTISRFVGAYAGYSECNSGAFVIDSVFIFPDPAMGPLFVKFVMQNYPHPPDTLIGKVQINQSVYSLLIPVVTAPHYAKEYTVTLQSGNSLNVTTYTVDNTNPLVTITNNCVFVGTLTTLK